MRRLKENCNILKENIINNLKAWGDNMSLKKEEIQKISNCSNKKKSQAEISLLKKEIFQFIKQKFSRNQSKTKLLNIFEKNQIYFQLVQKIEKLEKKMLDLTPIGNCMNEIKKTSNEQQIKCLQSTIKGCLSSEIKDIILFLTSQKVQNIQSLALSLLSSKINNFKSQLNIQFCKIFEYKNKFKEITEIEDVEKKIKEIDSLNLKLKELAILQPEQIINKKDEQIQQIIQKMADNYENKIKHKIFSIELFWRELNYLINVDEKYMVQQQKLLEKMVELKSIEVDNNLPFELIDGDMLEMPTKLMKQVFELRTDRALVLTILGPQSSGKSTLLNFLFGCDFATSQGRCTRGVYGTYFKFPEQFDDYNNCEGIFVLDTEGINAITNEGDKKNVDRKRFDSKLVLFCLAVSDIVIINVRGNLDQNTGKIVKLCHDKLESLNIQQKKRPEFAVIFNYNSSSRKEEAQNQLKQIQKSIKVDISQTLSQAYNNVNYDQKMISLFEKNEILTKKYPKKQFLDLTTNLCETIMKKISKRQNISPLNEIAQKFSKIWGMILTFPNLCCLGATKDYFQLKNKIQQWINDQDDESTLIQMYQQYRSDAITKEKIFQKIKEYHNKNLQQFDEQFCENSEDEQDIRNLKKQKRLRLQQKSFSIMANIQYKLRNIELKKKIKRQVFEGDCMIKQKAKEISNNQTIYSEEDLKVIFDKIFYQRLEKIKCVLNLKQEVIRQFEIIKHNYLTKMRSQTGKSLPKENCWIENYEQSIEEILRKLREKMLQPHEKSSEQVLQYTNKIYTNTLKGGKTDASLEYFNIKDYFDETRIQQIYGFFNNELEQHLNREAIQKLISNYYHQIKEKAFHRKQLKTIWNQINNSLKSIDLEFTNFDQFVEAFEKENGWLSHFRKKGKISYKFTQRPHELSTTKMNKAKTKGIKLITKRSWFSRESLIEGEYQQCSCKLSKYLIQYLEDNNNYERCLCNYQPLECSDYLMKRFYRHINWKMICLKMKVDIKEYTEEKQKQTNHKISLLINHDLKQINIQLKDPEEIDWIKQFQIQDQCSDRQNSSKMSTNYESNYYSGFNNISFQLINQQSQEISSKDKIIYAFDKLTYLKTRNLKLKIIQTSKQNLSCLSDFLPVFVIKTIKLEPKQDYSILNNYLKDSTSLTLQTLKQPICREFLFDSIKKNKSLDRFFDNIFNIVKSVISSWKIFSRKTFSEIYNKVTEEISKFNNDLNQMSYNLSGNYLRYINLSVVYMIWKLIIEQKIEEKRDIYEEKLREKESQWQSFKARSSKNQDINVKYDIKQFFKHFIVYVTEEIEKVKEECMNHEKNVFFQNNTREKIQNLIDSNIFQKETPEKEILDYLEKPYQVIQKKYKKCYEQSWKNFQNRYSTKKIAEQILKELFDNLKKLEMFFTEKQIKENNQSIIDLFEIVDEGKSVETFEQPQKKEYVQQGKRVLFEYFIDILLSKQEGRIRECSHINAHPAYKFQNVTQTSDILSKILLKIKTVKILEITNLIKFVRKTNQMKTIIMEQLDQITKLSQKDKIHYTNMIKVVICRAKCPCCGRGCGIENDHQFHQSLYGHQMKGFNGAFLMRDDRKEASVIRCEQMAESDLIKFNGKEQTWAEFKEHQKQKAHGGWIFDDANLNNKENQIKFENAWMIAGPKYCRKKNLSYVDANNSTIQKTLSNGNIHYIFALDQSGSMGGSKWNTFLKVIHLEEESKLSQNGDWYHLINSLGQTIEKIKDKDNGKNRRKVSIIKFADKATVCCQDLLPGQIRIDDIKYEGGGTDFDPPFLKAAQLAAKYIKESVIAFIFMTDGGGSMPIKGIKAIKRLQQENPGKLKYSGIKLKKSLKILNIIASEVNGKNKVAYNPDQLTDLFKKSIQVVDYEQNN